MVRTGQDYLNSLKNKRNIYVDGEKVTDVLSHSAFKGIAHSIAHLYDMVADEKNNMTYETEDGNRANKIWMIPKSKEDLASRREAITKWNQATYGMVGRSPDHVASYFAGFASMPEVFARGGEQYAENLLNFYKKARDNDLYLSYVIIPPQIDRTKAVHELDNEYLATGVYEEKEDGIVVRGSHMLGTGAAVSDYLFVSVMVPLRPGDEKYALSFVVPMDAPGLKLYTRPSYASDKTSVYDYPLSTRFDESDALVVFDDVFIPWEDIFIYKNIELLQAQFHETPAHRLGNNQAQIRFTNKLKFVIGIARKITAVNNVDKIPGVQEKLGELASLASSMEAEVLASEYQCYFDKNGTANPHPRFLYGAVGMQNNLYPRVIHLLRDLVGGGVLQVPSSYKELINPETKDDMEKFITSSSDIGTIEKVKLLRLAWDVIGSEFAGRHEQYEMFYIGAPYLAKAYAFRNYGYEETIELVDKCLSEYDIPNN